MVAGGCEKEASDEMIIRRISGFGVPVLVASVIFQFGSLA